MPYALLRPLLFSMNPEQAHEKRFRCLNLPTKHIFWVLCMLSRRYRLSAWVFLLLNPVGLAAGLDKMGRILMP